MYLYIGVFKIVFHSYFFLYHFFMSLKSFIVVYNLIQIEESLRIDWSRVTSGDCFLWVSSVWLIILSSKDWGTLWFRGFFVTLRKHLKEKVLIFHFGFEWGMFYVCHSAALCIFNKVLKYLKAYGNNKMVSFTKESEFDTKEREWWT